MVARVSSPAFVGRTAELAALRASLARVLAGGSECLLLAGEAGIGKTRLVQELLRDTTGLTVLAGGCVEIGADVLPHAPFVEMLTGLAGRDGPGEVRALAGPAGEELARLVPALGDGQPLATTRGGGRLYVALHGLLTGLAARGPLLLVIEDLHWSDPATRDLLALLSRRLPARTLLLLTARTDEADAGALRRFLAQLTVAGADRLDLAPLSRDEQARQLSGILGIPPSSARLNDVYSRAEGNPFFAEEIVALGAPDAVPGTIRDLLQARIGALPEETRRVLRAAAAAGRQVEHELLGAAVDRRGTALDDVLRPAVEAHVLLGDGHGYAFRHALLHETVEGGLLPAERAELHRKLAEALTGRPELAAHGTGRAGRIARHWLAAGDLERGRRASYDAAREAEAALAFDQALAHYERVLALPGDADGLPVAPYRLLADAAEAAHLAGAAGRAADLVEQAIARVDADRPHDHAHLHERLGRYLWMAAQGDRALAAYERAVELVPAEPVTRTQAAIVSGYSQVLMLSGRFVAAREQAERAIALTAQVRDSRSTEGHARNNLGCCLARLGDVEGGIAELRTAARIATEEFEDVDDIARAAVNLQSVLFDAGRFAEALEVARGAIAAVDGLGLYRRKGLWCRCDAIDSLLVLGRLEEVDTLLREALALEPEGIDRVRLTGVRGLRALRVGQLEEARRLLQETRRLGRHIVDGHLMLPMHRGLVETLRWQGDWSAAVAVVDEVRRRDWGEGDAAYLVPTLAAAAGAAADAAVAARTGRRPEDARRWAAQAADLLGEAESARSGAPHLLPPAATALESARAEHDRARGMADASAWAGIAEAWARLGDRLQAAVALMRAAECHLADRRRGPAADALADAREEAIEAGAMHVVHAADALSARAGLPTARPARRAAPFGLTTREIEVLALVARGHTDRQIGAALFISPRTVERHVSNILAKLDARTRAEVAAIAHREKLIGAG